MYTLWYFNFFKIKLEKYLKWNKHILMFQISCCFRITSIHENTFIRTSIFIYNCYFLNIPMNPNKESHLIDQPMIPTLSHCKSSLMKA